MDCSPFRGGNNRKIHLYENDHSKRCPKCKETKDFSEFYKADMHGRKKKHLSPYCKPCMGLAAVETRRKLKEQAIAYLGGICKGCNYSGCQAAFDFHHKDPSKKDFMIVEYRGTNLDKIKPELDKCILLCARCHRELHAGFRHI